ASGSRRVSMSKLRLLEPNFQRGRARGPMMTLRRWLVIATLCTMLVGCGNPWSSGDRVLVSKCAYDHGLTGPHRYEVVVFKFPGRWKNGQLTEGPMNNN